MFDLNPFNAPLRQAKELIDSLSKEKLAIEKELQWFNSNSQKDLAAKLEKYRNQSITLQSSYKTIELDIIAHQAERNILAAKIKHLDERDKEIKAAAAKREGRQRVVKIDEWNKLAEAIFAKSRLEKLDKILGGLTSKTNHFSIHIKVAAKQIKIAQTILNYFTSFDIERHKKILQAIESQLSAELLRAKEMAGRKNDVDQALKPFIDEIKRHEQLIREKNSTLERAKDFENQLSDAGDSSERAMIHQDCDREFGDARPQKIIGQCKNEIQNLARNYKKIYKRAVEIGQIAARKINKVVIDGNNLCYENAEFIGLSALSVIVPLLQSKYSITIIFNAAIRAMLKMNNKALSNHFGNKITVHVVATRGKADETILDLAGTDKHIYVLSNDSFVDFNDKPAIQDERLIRHEIVDGRIFIHGLEINTSYKQHRSGI